MVCDTKSSSTNQLYNMKHQTISRKLIAFTLFIGLFSLTSCFNILEEITIRKDGSGTYRFSIDGKAIAQMAQGIAKNMGETNKDSTATQMDTVQKIDKFAGLKRMPGISNVKEIENKDAMEMGVTFDFANLAALKSVMDSLGDIKMFGTLGVGRDLKIDGKTIRRDNTNSIRNIITAAMNQNSGEKGSPAMDDSNPFMEMILGSMSFTQVYHFPDRKVKKCNVKGAEISKDKHTLTILEKPFAPENKNKKSGPAELTIRLK